MMNKFHIALLLVLVGVLMPMAAFAQGVQFPQYLDFSNSGGGARAAGMGGAYMGVSDDEMAFSWNPAGMIYITKPKLGLQMASKADRMVSLVRQNLLLPDDSVAQYRITNPLIKRDHFNLNYSGVAVPFTFIDREWIAGGGYRNVFDMNFNFTSDGILSGTHNTFDQTGGVDAVSVALAGKIAEGYGIGVTVNDYIRHSEFNYFQESALLLDSVYYNYRLNSKSHYSGVNADIGASAEFSMVRASAVFHTPFNLKENVLATNTFEIPPQPYAGNIYRYTGTTKIPMAYSIGISARPMEALLVDVDFDSRAMSKSRTKINYENTDFPDYEINPRWKDISQFRIGAEYRFKAGFADIPVRAGFRNNPSVERKIVVDSLGNTTSSDTQVNTNVLSFGTGLTFQKAWVDLAYQFGKNKNEVGNYIYQKNDMSRLIISAGIFF